MSLLTFLDSIKLPWDDESGDTVEDQEVQDEHQDNYHDGEETEESNARWGRTYDQPHREETSLVSAGLGLLVIGAIVAMVWPKS